MDYQKSARPDGTMTIEEALLFKRLKHLPGGPATVQEIKKVVANQGEKVRFSLKINRIASGPYRGTLRLSLTAIRC